MLMAWSIQAKLIPRFRIISEPFWVHLGLLRVWQDFRVCFISRVGCFTALRVRVSTECRHAYVFDVVLGSFREHIFVRGFLALIHF